jgi:hypothetical protein
MARGGLSLLKLSVARGEGIVFLCESPFPISHFPFTRVTNTTRASLRNSGVALLWCLRTYSLPDGVSGLELGIRIRTCVYAYAIYNVRPRLHLRLIFHLLAGGEERGRKHADPVGGLSVARSDPPARGTDRGHRHSRLASRRGAELETPGSVQLPLSPPDNAAGGWPVDLAAGAG